MKNLAGRVAKQDEATMERAITSGITHERLSGFAADRYASAFRAAWRASTIASPRSPHIEAIAAVAG